MRSSTTDHVVCTMTQEPSGGPSMENESCLTQFLMSPITRFWVGCAIIGIAPWVLLLEQPAEALEGWDEDDLKF